MYEPAGMFPGEGIVAGGGRLAVALHASVGGGGDGWTISAPFGITSSDFVTDIVDDEAELAVDVPPHAASMTAKSTPSPASPRPRRLGASADRPVPITDTPRYGVGIRPR